MQQPFLIFLLIAGAFSSPAIFLFLAGYATSCKRQIPDIPLIGTAAFPPDMLPPANGKPIPTSPLIGTAAFRFPAGYTASCKRQANPNISTDRHSRFPFLAGYAIRKQQAPMHQSDPMAPAQSPAALTPLTIWDQHISYRS